MTNTFWMGEVQSKNGNREIDFPVRRTKEEALKDAQERCLDQGDEAIACEWEGEVGDCVNTGNVYEGK